MFLPPVSRRPVLTRCPIKAPNPNVRPWWRSDRGRVPTAAATSSAKKEEEHLDAASELTGMLAYDLEEGGILGNSTFLVDVGPGREHQLDASSSIIWLLDLLTFSCPKPAPERGRTLSLDAGTPSFGYGTLNFPTVSPRTETMTSFGNEAPNS